MYFAIDDKPNLLLALASRLAFLTLDNFIGVSDAVTVIGFGNSYGADIGSRLSDENFIYSADRDFVGGRTSKGYASGFNKFDRMGKSYVHNELIALLCNLPTYAVYF